MSLHADDGTELPVKEGVILDPKENVVIYASDQTQEQDSFESIFSEHHQNVRVFRLGLWSIPLLVVGLVLTFVLGTFVLTAFIALFLIFVVIRSVVNLFRLRL